MMGNAHDWVESRLGHGESMCRNCFITNREAAALGLMNECNASPRTADQNSEAPGNDAMRQEGHTAKGGCADEAVSPVGGDKPAPELQ